MIQVGKAQLIVDLVVIPLPNFDVIMGRDWLFEHHIVMNGCYQGGVDKPSGQPAAMFHRDKQGLTCCLVSANEANKMVRAGCEAYLA